MSPLPRYREHVLRARTASKRQNYRSLHVYQLSCGLERIRRRTPPRKYKNDVRETHTRDAGLNAHRFSSIAGAIKPHLRTENMTRVENTNVPNPTKTYRGCFRPRFVSRCRVRPCFTTTILCGCFESKNEPKRSVKFYIYKTIIWKDFLSRRRARSTMDANEEG